MINLDAIDKVEKARKYFDWSLWGLSLMAIAWYMVLRLTK